MWCGWAWVLGIRSEDRCKLQESYEKTLKHNQRVMEVRSLEMLEVCTGPTFQTPNPPPRDVMCAGGMQAGGRTTI